MTDKGQNVETNRFCYQHWEIFHFIFIYVSTYVIFASQVWSRNAIKLQILVTPSLHRLQKVLISLFFSLILDVQKP